MRSPELGGLPPHPRLGGVPPPRRPSAPLRACTPPLPGPRQFTTTVRPGATRREPPASRARAGSGGEATPGPGPSPSTSEPAAPSSRFLVRRARPEDADAIAAICEVAFPDQVRDPGLLRRLFLPGPADARVDIAAQVRLALARKRKAAVAHRAYRLER